MLNWLLIFVPVTLALELLAPQLHLLIFISAAVSIIPLAGWLGRATEQLAEPAVKALAACSMQPSAMPPN